MSMNECENVVNRKWNGTVLSSIWTPGRRSRRHTRGKQRTEPTPRSGRTSKAHRAPCFGLCLDSPIGRALPDGARRAQRFAVPP